MLHKPQVMPLLPRMKAQRCKLGFHLCAYFIWIRNARNQPQPPESPLTTLTPTSSLLSPTTENSESQPGMSDETWPPAAPCATVANFQNSLTFPLYTPSLETNGIILIQLRRFNS